MSEPATRWGRCTACHLPGLAPARQFALPTPPRCGFCGGALAESDEDLGDEAARVIAEPQRREGDS